MSKLTVKKKRKSMSSKIVGKERRILKETSVEKESARRLLLRRSLQESELCEINASELK